MIKIGKVFNKKKKQDDYKNPYLSSRKVWNDHVSSVVSSRMTWQVIGLLSLIIALAAVGGIIHIGKQSKFIPYVVEVDKLGQAIAGGAISSTTKADSRVLSATVSSFIYNSRLVTPDIALQRRAVFQVYSHLNQNDPAITKMNEWMNGDAESNPFKRAAKEIVNIEIVSLLSQSEDTWQIDWIETIRDRQGMIKGKPVNMRALVTLYTADISQQTTDEQMRNNPLNIFVRDFSWTRIL